jgi:outer membrane protein OmpA-like peptidoglycan-associated protein
MGIERKKHSIPRSLAFLLAMVAHYAMAVPIGGKVHSLELHYKPGSTVLESKEQARLDSFCVLVKAKVMASTDSNDITIYDYYDEIKSDEQDFVFVSHKRMVNVAEQFLRVLEEKCPAGLGLNTCPGYPYFASVEGYFPFHHEDTVSRSLLKVYFVMTGLKAKMAPLLEDCVKTYGGEQIVIKDTLYFPSGSAQLSEFNKSKLRKFAEKVRPYVLAYPSFKNGKGCPFPCHSFLLISGHSDSVGVHHDQGNRDLSGKRSYNVWKYLEYDDYFKKSPIRAETRLLAKGELFTISTNKTEKGRQKNRRVELTFFRYVMLHNVRMGDNLTFNIAGQAEYIHKNLNEK